MQDITLSLAVDEVNLVLEGLGNLPFAKVYELVAKIQGQAAEQIRSRTQTETPPGRPRAEGT